MSKNHNPLYNALLAEYYSVVINISCTWVEGGSDGTQQSTTMKQASVKADMSTFGGGVVAFDYFMELSIMCVVVFSKSCHVSYT